MQGRARSRPKTPTWQPHGCTNWMVRRDGGDVVAVEPDREHEHVFEGGLDDFGAALNFAAAELRKEMDCGHTDNA